MTEVQKKRREAAQKAAQTAREHREKWKERERERQEELAAQIAALRRVRANPDSSSADVLHAVELLVKLENR